MSKKWLTIVQNDSAEDATFTSVYCWRVLAGAQRRAWEVPAGAQRRAGTGGLKISEVEIIERTRNREEWRTMTAKVRTGYGT